MTVCLILQILTSKHNFFWALDSLVSIVTCLENNSISSRNLLQKEDKAWFVAFGFSKDEER